ncbi:hypothetical protein HN604_00755 [archaeon]|jgi:hypothetical protein|nr:hypothetical protein [archaeon]MBT6182397.1 hypothetical protein [archaeon]MBT6606447.1 hypothetical protein [archaeon]MBT7660595.1 hypothetical protein [archaeon]
MEKENLLQNIFVLLIVSVLLFPSIASAEQNCDTIEPCGYWCEGIGICAGTQEECDANPNCKYDCIDVNCGESFDPTISEKYDVTKRIADSNLKEIKIVQAKNIKGIFSESLLKAIFPGYNFFKNVFGR